MIHRLLSPDRSPAVPPGSGLATAPGTRLADRPESCWAAADAALMPQVAESRLPVEVLGGHGVWVTVRGLGAGAEERRVLDASGFWATSLVGHGNECLRRELESSLAAGACGHDQVYDRASAQLALRALGPEGVFAAEIGTDFWMCGRSSGTEAVEAALRIAWDSRYNFENARWVEPRRRRILSFRGGWHGWSAATSPLGGRRTHSVGLPTYAPDSSLQSTILPYGDTTALLETFSRVGDEIGAAIVEPIQGSAGVVAPPEGFLRTLQELCADHGAFLIADEVMTWGRTESFFAMRDEKGPVAADIYLVGKGLSGGVLPVSLVIARRDLCSPLGRIMSTFDLRPMQSAVALGVIDIVAGAQKAGQPALIGKALERELARAAAEHPRLCRGHRGRGTLWAIDLDPCVNPTNLRHAALREGILLDVLPGYPGRTGRSVLLAPSILSAPPEIELMGARLRAALRAYSTG